MSATVATRNTPHMPRSSSRNQSPIDKKANVKSEEPSKETSSQSNQKDVKSPPRPDPQVLKQEERGNKDHQPATSNAEAAQPLAPPPKPSQSNGEGNDYFSSSHGNSHYSLEPNLFEQSFGTGNTPETPGKSLLPPVASLTSPQLLSANGSLGGSLNWNGSLRSGPLSPAMLSGPTGAPGDYFDTNLRGTSFPTPNESSLRTGLTPGGGGSMFPAPSPNTQALFNSMASGGATPNTLEFQRTAMNAAAANKPGQSASNIPTSQPAAARAMEASNQAATNNQSFGNHDNEAANGLYLLAQAGNESQSNNQFAVPNQPAHVNQDKRPRNATGSVGSATASTQGQSEMSGDHSENDSKQNTRKPKRASAGKTNKRKNEDTPTKQPAKKAKSTTSSKNEDMDMDDMSDDQDMNDPEDGNRKMTDEEKRKNFLERNRVAALKCRQRKKQWLANLQAKVEIFSSENDALNSQVSSLREEILNLKTILINHKDCPISQTQPQSVSSYLPPGQSEFQNHPYMMQQQGQPVMTAGPRRFS